MIRGKRLSIARWILIGQYKDSSISDKISLSSKRLNLLTSETRLKSGICQSNVFLIYFRYDQGHVSHCTSITKNHSYRERKSQKFQIKKVMEKILSWAVIGWNMRKPHSKICHNVRTRTDLILSFYTYDLVQPFILTVSNRIVQWWFMSKWIPPMISFISLSIPWSKFILIAGLTKFYSPIQRRNIAVYFKMIASIVV